MLITAVQLYDEFISRREYDREFCILTDSKCTSQSKKYTFKVKNVKADMGECVSISNSKVQNNIHPSPWKI